MFISKVRNFEEDQEDGYRRSEDDEGGPRIQREEYGGEYVASLKDPLLTSMR